MTPRSAAEHACSFECFGGRAAVYVDAGNTEEQTADAAIAWAQRELLSWHEQFTRFRADSELSRLNDDIRTTVPASERMIRFVAAAIEAARHSGGLVDATLIGALELAGYATSRADGGRASERRLPSMHATHTAGPRSAAPWPAISVDADAGTVTRPPGVRFDSGGIVKGLAADVIGARLAVHRTFAVDCAGDLRIGGSANAPRRIEVEHPIDAGVLNAFEIVDGGIATSGVTKRSWRQPDGRMAHHLIDPATGAPAWTGVIQATALAPSALEAEVLAKTALLSGRSKAAGWLPHGGVLVYDDGAADVVTAGDARHAAA